MPCANAAEPCAIRTAPRRPMLTPSVSRRRAYATDASERQSVSARALISVAIETPLKARPANRWSFSTGADASDEISRGRVAADGRPLGRGSVIRDEAL